MAVFTWLLTESFFIELHISFPTPSDSPFNKKFGLTNLVGRPRENSLLTVSSFIEIIKDDSLWAFEMVGETNSDLFLRVPKAEQSKNEFLGVCFLITRLGPSLEYNSNFSLLSSFAFEVLETLPTALFTVSANSAEFKV